MLIVKEFIKNGKYNGWRDGFFKKEMEILKRN